MKHCEAGVVESLIILIYLLHTWMTLPPWPLALTSCISRLEAVWGGCGRQQSEDWGSSFSYLPSPCLNDLTAHDLSSPVSPRLEAVWGGCGRQKPHEDPRLQSRRRWRNVLRVPSCGELPPHRSVVVFICLLSCLLASSVVKLDNPWLCIYPNC